MTDQELQKYQEFSLSGRLHGTTVSRLEQNKSIGAHDVFIFSRRYNSSISSEQARILDEYQDGIILLEEEDELVGTQFLANEEYAPVVYSDCSSFGIEYCDLCAQTVGDSKGKIFLGSMAFESKDDYAKIGHNHDDIYSKFDAEEKFTPTDEKFWKLMTIHISNFMEDGTCVTKTVDITAPSVLLPKFQEEEIGTLRFIGINNLGTEVRDYGGKKNIDIFSENFDGWVYPNGTTFTVGQNQFLSACQTYGESPTATQFTVPDLHSFVKLNPGTSKTNSIGFSKYQNGLPNHIHQATNLNITGQPSNPKVSVGIGEGKGTGYVCGFGDLNDPRHDVAFNVTGEFKETSINNVTCEESDPSLDVEQKPTHNLMPVMIYIGKRTEEES